MFIHTTAVFNLIKCSIYLQRNFVTTVIFFYQLTILINLRCASFKESVSTIRFTKIKHILTKWLRIFRSLLDRWSQHETVAYIVKNIRHWSAVKLEKLSPQSTFPGIRLKSNGTLNSFIFF